MTRCAVFVACVGAFCLGIAPTASAEPITITTGFVHVDNIQSVGETLVETTMLLGTDGFRFNSGSAVNGFHCDCEPGAHMRFTGTFEDAGGTARVMFDGRGLNIRVSDETAFVRIDTGTVMLPPITPGHTVLTVPFELEGVVRPEDLSMFPNGLEFPFSGQGTAHFEFVPEGPFFGGPVNWHLVREDYDFAPTPEPATLTMVGGVLVACAMRARKRHAANGSAAHSHIRLSKVGRSQA